LATALAGQKFFDMADDEVVVLAGHSLAQASQPPGFDFAEVGYVGDNAIFWLCSNSPLMPLNI
jgi:hypothetical protein